MRWEDERYVRLYTRDTVDWEMMPWQSRALFPLLLRKVDRAGIIDLGRYGLEGLAMAIDIPVDFVQEGMAGLLKDGCVEIHGEHLVIKNFIEAQETISTPASRQRDSRERKRDMVRRGLKPEQRGCVIYFIQSEHGGPIKIGQTQDVAHRLVQLQTSRPDKLVILAAAPGTLEEERLIHDHFSNEREKGEWFSSSDRLMQYIGHVVRTGSVTCDWSQNVTSHSVPIRTVPSEPKLSASADQGQPSLFREIEEHTPEGAKPEPLPFKPDAAIEALSRASRGRFVATKLTKGQSVYVVSQIRANPDLGTWKLVGDWLAAGGEGWRQSVDVRAIGDFTQWVAHARAWDEGGRRPIGRTSAPAKQDPPRVKPLPFRKPAVVGGDS